MAGKSSSRLAEITAEIKAHADPPQAVILQRFFKTGFGEYGHGDIFLGLKVPVSRKISSKYKDLDLDDISKLLSSKIHEERLIALFILIYQYRKAGNRGREKIYKFYIKNRKYINSWDLVDLSAPNIIGDFLMDKDKEILYRYAVSKNLWERRIAVLSTFTFLKKGDFSHTFMICDLLTNDKHDLIHKASGWMLREAGKRDYGALEEYLIPRYREMPRTMLRYAIEKFPEERRQEFLKGSI